MTLNDLIGSNNFLEAIRKISVSDFISIFSVIFIIIGGAFAFYQWGRNTTYKRAEYINELTEKIRTDESIKYTVYLIDYGNVWYDERFHGSNDIELKVDKTLSYFSYICYLYSRRIINKKEFAFFEYEITRIITNNNVRFYFFNLYHFAEKNRSKMTFQYLFKYAEKKKVFVDEFYDKDNEEYCKRKYLNF